MPFTRTTTVGRGHRPSSTAPIAHVAVLCVALLATACGAGPTADSASAGSAPTGAARDPAASARPSTPEATARTTAPASSTRSASGAACDGTERPRLQAGSHLIRGGDPPVPYSSRPPTSGWHASGRIAVDVRNADDPLTEPEQVSVLEAGGVVVAHGTLRAEQAAALAEHVAERHAGRVAVTPYAPLAEGEVAFAGWGVVQRCARLDLAALDRFVHRFGADAPVEPGH